LTGSLVVEIHASRRHLGYGSASNVCVGYSVGPDGKDDRARTEYDPTNCLRSGGDLRVIIPKEREYPTSEGNISATPPPAAVELTFHIRRLPRSFEKFCELVITDSYRSALNTSLYLSNGSGLTGTSLTITIVNPLNSHVKALFPERLTRVKPFSLFI